MPPQNLEEEGEEGEGVELLLLKLEQVNLRLEEESLWIYLVNPSRQDRIPINVQLHQIFPAESREYHLTSQLRHPEHQEENSARMLTAQFRVGRALQHLPLKKRVQTTIKCLLTVFIQETVRIAVPGTLILSLTI